MNFAIIQIVLAVKQIFDAIFQSNVDYLWFNKLCDAKYEISNKITPSES